MCTTQCPGLRFAQIGPVVGPEGPGNGPKEWCATIDIDVDIDIMLL